jgi:hypothetical protein
MRSDIHTMFDRGFLGADADYKHEFLDWHMREIF